MKRLLISLLAMSVVLSALSMTSLPLSDSQIQKLQQYLPTDDDNAPLIWKGDPIFVAIPVEKEKRLIFPEPVQVDLNGSLTTDQLRIINNDQNLYLTAHQAFAKTRLFVTLKNSQQIILLDVATDNQASPNTRTISLPKNTKSTSIAVAKPQNNNPLNNATINSNQTVSADDYVNALRFAWQQLYAPQRLINQDLEFTRTPMHTTSWVTDLVYGDKVLAHPEASWLLNGLYVTAIELRNKYPHDTTLTARDLCGDWQAATLYPRTHLKPAGQKPDDSTTLLLISTKPFSDVLGVCHGSA
ncbi:MAG TPA: TIGR03749 family integrating conjugative element protein [Gammaproteobacteria bacterium]|nr:TIGR03749 family integrating conjugative element protein [Gammaproteobacteria bacterium]HVY53946.1 TIGR03749 family integrating conjugative element protein [Gammaproteobacteria bacterium]